MIQKQWNVPQNALSWIENSELVAKINIVDFKPFPDCVNIWPWIPSSKWWLKSSLWSYLLKPNEILTNCAQTPDAIAKSRHLCRLLKENIINHCLLIFFIWNFMVMSKTKPPIYVCSLWFSLDNLLIAIWFCITSTFTSITNFKFKYTDFQ